MTYFDYADEYAPMATMSDAHREWHLNAGVPMGQPGCPQDACHLPDDYDEPDEWNDDDGLTDVEADAMTLSSAGWGTDEDYGYFGGEDAGYEEGLFGWE